MSNNTFKSSNDIYHGDEHLIDESNYIKKSWIDYKFVVTWDDGTEEDLTDSKYIDLTKGSMDIEEQLNDIQDSRNGDGEWGYQQDVEEHF